MRLLRGCGINRRSNLRDAVGGKPALVGVLADRLFIRGYVDAVDIVVGDVALDPLNLRSHLSQNATRFLRYGMQLLR